MADLINIQSNILNQIIILGLPIPEDSDLVYTKGGGTIFPILQEDYVQGGNIWHKGHSVVTVDLKTKICDNVVINSTKFLTKSAEINKGLISYNESTDKYYWDEVYCSPLGQFVAIPDGDTITDYEFYFTSENSEELYISTKDKNIIPKEGDYIVIQKTNNVIPLVNTSYTDDLNSFEVEVNSELYQFKILNVIISVVDAENTIYKLILDKSFAPITGQYYNFVLLNRSNTGIQKELFYDTFEQIEFHREQLLGDPYDNISNSVKQKGRKNYLDYAGSSYLGLKNLLKGVINSTDTPVIVYDITDDIKDKFNNELNKIEVLLPFILIQEDTRVLPALLKPNKLINKGTVLTDSSGIGEYSGLYFEWDDALAYRVGWVFYDLRIIVLDDSETVYALSYNSNRNYTLPKPRLTTNFGNDLKNPGGGLDLEISNITNTNPIEVTTTLPHGLVEGTAIFIKDAKVKDGTNTVISSSANGFNYVKLVYPNGPGQPADPNKFTLWDSSLSNPVAGNGNFVKNTGGSSGVVLGTIPEYKYFFIYRLRGVHYSSILPYSKITNFNFAKNGKVDDTSSAQLTISFDTFKFLIDDVNSFGYQATDLELIIGRYLNDDPIKPNLITGFTDVVTIPITELSTDPRNLINGGIQVNLQNIVITKQDYETFISKIGGSGTYDKTTNTNGDPTYDIKNNYLHYKYVSGADVPDTLLVGNGKWTLGNIKYKNLVEKFRTTMYILIPADKWNDTTNPSYDPTNSFITDRYISEIALLVEGDTTDTPAIYAKIAPAIKKTNQLDISISMSLDF